VTESVREPADKEQQLLRNARREGRIIMGVWLLALVWTVAVSYLLGYDRPAAQVGLVFGFPDWVFWGVIVPWGLCLAYSVWFCFVTMADDDLGQDPEERTGHA
jgi:hypothetical protein